MDMRRLERERERGREREREREGGGGVVWWHVCGNRKETLTRISTTEAVREILTT